MGESNHAALLETAKAELERAHRAALTMDGGEMRRALALAITALRDVGAESVAKLEQALVDLDSGKLVEMESLVEAVRSELER